MRFSLTRLPLSFLLANYRYRRNQFTKLRRSMQSFQIRIVGQQISERWVLAQTFGQQAECSGCELPVIGGAQGANTGCLVSRDRIQG